MLKIAGLDKYFSAVWTMPWRQYMPNGAYKDQSGPAQEKRMDTQILQRHLVKVSNFKQILDSWIVLQNKLLIQYSAWEILSCSCECERVG